MVTRKAKSRHYPLIPEEERKCVWMATGLISYKLCDKDFQCEQCNFDQAIKHQETKESAECTVLSAGSSVHSTQSSALPIRVNGSLFYHSGHCWVKVENCETARIGIDDLLTRLIARVKVITLPEVGTFVAQGDCFAHIIEEDHILPVTAPLAGIVQAVNTRLKNEPELVTNEPRGAGWLITIKPEHLEGDLKNLLFGKDALSWYQGQEREIIAQSEVLLRQDSPELGPTMQDGGVVMNSLEEILKIMNPLQRAQLLDFSLSRAREVHQAVKLESDCQGRR